MNAPIAAMIAAVFFFVAMLAPFFFSVRRSATFRRRYVTIPMIAGRRSLTRGTPTWPLPGRFPGKHEGLNCSGTPVGQKPTVIECGSNDLTKTLLATVV